MPVTFAPGSASALAGDLVVFTGIIDVATDTVVSKSAELVQRKNQSLHGAICYTVDTWSGTTPLEVDSGTSSDTSAVWMGFRNYVFDSIGAIDYSGGTPNDSTSPVAGDVTVTTADSIVLAVMYSYTSQNLFSVSGGGLTWSAVRTESGFNGDAEPAIAVFQATGVSPGTITGVTGSTVYYDANIYLIVLRPV